MSALHAPDCIHNSIDAHTSLKGEVHVILLFVMLRIKAIGYRN